MFINSSALLRFFSPRILYAALRKLDKSTALVISSCWLAALVVIVISSLAVHGAVSARKEADKARLAEPALPVITSKAISPDDLRDKVLDPLKRQFPDLKIEIRQGQGGERVLYVRSDEGVRFQQWITALSYIDTMVPQYRWTVRDFCVGDCPGGTGLMSATIVGQQIVITVSKK